MIDKSDGLRTSNRYNRENKGSWEEYEGILFCLLSQQFFHFFFSIVVGKERNNWGMTLGKAEARCFMWNYGSTLMGHTL